MPAQRGYLIEASQLLDTIYPLFEIFQRDKNPIPRPKHAWRLEGIGAKQTSGLLGIRSNIMTLTSPLEEG